LQKFGLIVVNINKAMKAMMMIRLVRQL